MKDKISIVLIIILAFATYNLYQHKDDISDLIEDIRVIQGIGIKSNQSDIQDVKQYVEVNLAELETEINKISHESLCLYIEEVVKINLESMEGDK